MSFTDKTENEPNAATLAFWEAAEAGQLAVVEAKLPQVADINARNEHGVTALMRAAQHGHAKVVRLLLAHGADANIIRNDKFTALSLAAFFGHTEVVRALMEHGADSKASTRHGTSPHMWATARTFNEVVSQLDKPKAPPREEHRVTEPAPRTAAPVIASAASASVPGPVTSAIVRTLKDPPEIWDLVHEVPRGFNARTAFVGHMRSMRLTVRTAAAVGLVGAFIVGVLVLRGAQARSEVTLQAQPAQALPVVELQRENKASESHSPQPVAATATAPELVAPVLPQNTRDFGTTPTRRRSSHSRVVRSPAVELATPPPAAVSESVQRSAAPSEKVDLKVPPAATPRTPSSSPLSPQLITPAKNVSPKSKVIQWP